MPSTVFNELLSEQIEIFRNSFSSVSRATYYDEEAGRLRHAGEFGMYREAICRDFLRFLIPGRLTLGQGFLINTHDEVSTQCDIVVYDGQSTPLIQSDERQRFFPVETVCAVGEVKSVMSKTDLKEALRKLANAKLMRERVDASNPVILRKHEGKYDPECYVYDQLVTFLVCERFDFQLDGLSMDDLYEDGMPRRHRHNLILSLQDGLLLYYYDQDKKILPWPVFTPKGTTVDLRDHVIRPFAGWKFVHFNFFASYVFMVTSSATILFPEMVNYMGSVGGSGLEQLEGTT